MTPINHIIPYLPYQLKFELLDYKSDYVGEKYGICNGFYFIGDGAYYTFKDRSTAGKNTNNCKPILKPIADLNTLIHKDELECTYFDWILVEYDINIFKFLDTHGLEKLPYEVMEYLLEHHFDIFGLIEKKQAVDINTLK